MPDRLTPAAGPWLAAAFIAIESFLLHVPDMFGIPAGAVLTAIGGAYWAVFRHPTLKVHKSIFVILGAAAIACVMVHGINWLLSLLSAPKIDQRPVTFILGFSVIDKPTRDLIKGIVKQKLGYSEAGK